MFTKYSRQIIVAAKAGGDPEFNPSLRVAIDKAKSIGMPNDNINRAIKKGTGELGGESYEELQFEGYGPSGVAVIVEALTDNKNRTASFVRSVFDKNGGNLGTPGCVSYMFNSKGVLVLDNEDGDLDEDTVMDAALEAGADVYLTGEMAYHKGLDAMDNGLCVIEAGHCATEYPAISLLCRGLQNAADAVQYGICVLQSESEVFF
jgi:YebC/PmpR family DNA-binding regulatory protein